MTSQIGVQPAGAVRFLSFPRAGTGINLTCVKTLQIPIWCARIIYLVITMLGFISFKQFSRYITTVVYTCTCITLFLGSLMKQLNRLSVFMIIAQLVGAIGREYST